MPHGVFAMPANPPRFAEAARDIVAGWPPFTDQQRTELILLTAEIRPVDFAKAA